MIATRTRHAIAGAVAGTLACARAPAPEAAKPPPAGSTPAIVFASGKPCDEEPNVEEAAKASAASMKQSLISLGFSPVDVVEAATGQGMLARVRSVGTEALLVAYTGHAALVDDADRLVEACGKCGARCRSVLCLDDERLTLDALVGAVPKGAKLVTFLVDACASSHVDVRYSKSPVSVISASPFTTTLDLRGGTPLSIALAELPSDVDLDCNQQLSAAELFHGLVRKTPTGTYTSPQPKLRNQVSEGTALLLTPRGIRCASVEPTVDSGTPSAVEPYHCGPSERVRVEGVVDPSRPLPLAGAARHAGDLVPIPCEHDSGQCFRATTDPACALEPKGAGCNAW